jgi:lupus La protein
MRRIDGSKEKEFKVRFSSAGVFYMLCRSRVTSQNTLQGSVFVEFADFASVGAFLNADPKPSWNDQELLIMSK